VHREVTYKCAKRARPSQRFRPVHHSARAVALAFSGADRLVRTVLATVLRPTDSDRPQQRPSSSRVVLLAFAQCALPAVDGAAAAAVCVCVCVCVCVRLLQARILQPGQGWRAACVDVPGAIVHHLTTGCSRTAGQVGGTAQHRPWTLPGATGQQQRRRRQGGFHEAGAFRRLR
jgi:hypothetical protein